MVTELGAALSGHLAAPAAAYRAARGWLSLAGYQGLALAAVAGLDIALWDALAQAAGLPLARLLGGTGEPVPAYNSNGLGLIDPAAAGDEALELLAEGGFTALKVRVGRASAADDLAAVRKVRDAVGDGVTLVADYNQGLDLGDALLRCRALDGEGLAWIEEPLRYDDLTGHARLARDIATPVMLGENFYGPRAMLAAIQAQRLRPGHAGPDADRRGHRLAAGRRDRRHVRPADVLAPVPGGIRPPARASPRPGTGWSGRTGPTRCWPTRSRSGTACCTCPTSPAPACPGTKTPSRVTPCKAAGGGGGGAATARTCGAVGGAGAR